MPVSYPDSRAPEFQFKMVINNGQLNKMQTIADEGMIKIS